MTNISSANENALDSDDSHTDTSRVDTRSANDEAVLALHEETFSVAKRVVETGRVQISRVTHSRQQDIDELLHHERVEVERVPVDRPIDAMPSIREEGDVTIIPVVEEVVTVQRHLVLKEEVHVRRIKHTERYQESVTLRRQEAQVSRTPIERPGGLVDGNRINSNNPGKEHP